MATYDWGDTSQLEVLEVVHLTLALLRICIFRTRVLHITFAMSSTTFLLNLTVHSRREGMYRMAIGRKKKDPSGTYSDEPKGDSLKERH